MSIISGRHECALHGNPVIRESTQMDGISIILSPQHQFKLQLASYYIPVLCYSKTILDTRAMIHLRKTNFLVASLANQASFSYLCFKEPDFFKGKKPSKNHETKRMHE